MLPKASPVRYPFKPVLTVVPAPRVRQFIDNHTVFLFCKRIVDIAFSALFLVVVMSWLVPLLYVIIRLDSKGPAFFVQKRVGRGGRSFRCYKFRTMHSNRHADSRQCSSDDERVTRVGRFLRTSNMDEFPQFVNVLMGSMSLIGPRPHMYADCRHFSSLIPGYKLRNLVKPGMTGLAQVKGFYGPTASRESILLRYHWDIRYLHNMNWRMDTRIFLLTIAQRTGAFVSFAGRLLSHATGGGFRYAK